MTDFASPEQLDRFESVLLREPRPTIPEVGTTSLLPCSGCRREGIVVNPKNHALQVLQVKLNSRGDREWQKGDWLSSKEATLKYPSVSVGSSHGLCPQCLEMNLNGPASTADTLPPSQVIQKFE